MNKRLQRLTKAVKYTTMGDIWREIDEGGTPGSRQAGHRGSRQATLAADREDCTTLKNG